MCCGTIIDSGIDIVAECRFEGADRSHKDCSFKKVLESGGAEGHIREIDGVLSERCMALLTVEKRKALAAPSPLLITSPTIFN